MKLSPAMAVALTEFVDGVARRPSDGHDVRTFEALLRRGLLETVPPSWEDPVNLGTYRLTERGSESAERIANGDYSEMTAR